jgi:DNA-binding NarL/FixJ family response regulator
MGRIPTLKMAEPLQDPQIQVMLVDDNPSFLHVASGFLKRQEWLSLVGTAGGGQEALALAPTLQPRVIVIDLDMPEMSGLEAIRRLREALPQTRIIALTLLDSDTYRQTAFSAGADSYITKCSLVTELLPAIRAAIY